MKHKKGRSRLSLHIIRTKLYHKKTIGFKTDNTDYIDD